MRFIPTSVHGVIDYLWGLALLSAPWLLGFSDVPGAKWVAVAFGLSAILYAALTAYEFGVLRILPMPLHLILDGLAGAVLAICPFLFRFADQVYLPHLIFGLFSVAASLLTRMESTLSTGRREPA